MKIETLKTLIKDVINNDALRVVMSLETIELEKKIMKVIDLYEEDNSEPTPNPFIPTPGFRVDIPIQHGEPDEVPYGTICPCNPANGGSGLCGCVMGNKMVPNPKKYGTQTSNWGTTTTDTITGYAKGTTFTNTPGNTSIKIKTTND